MELAPINVPLTFEVTYDSDSLFVGQSIYDCTTGTPILVAGPTLMQNVVGNTYIGQFLPTVPTKSYLVFKAVYTDGDLDTLDSNYSQASESFVTENVGGGPSSGGSSIVGYVDQVPDIVGYVQSETTIVGYVNC